MKNTSRNNSLDTLYDKVMFQNYVDYSRVYHMGCKINYYNIAQTLDNLHLRMKFTNKCNKHAKFSVSFLIKDFLV